MDLDEIKQGLRAEIKKRENEQYFTFQCNVRQMCKDVLAKLEEQESLIAELKEKHKTEVKELLCLIRDKENNFNRAFDSEEKELRHSNYKRCLAMVRCCMADNHTLSQVTLNEITNHLQWLFNENFFVKWAARWSKIADKFKEAK